MPTPLSTPVRITAAAELYASIPHLMGFHPADSLVVLVLDGPAVSMSMRVDLPRPRHRGLLAAQLGIPLLEHGAREVILVVICAPSEHVPEVLPHARLITMLRNELGGVGIDVVESVWLPTCAKDAPWYCYQDVDCHGTLPDPETSALAAATAHAGYVTFESRAAMAATLEPDPPEALERRSALLDDLMAESDPPDPGTELCRVRLAVDAVEHRERPLTDVEIVALMRALTLPEVRDACMSFAVQSKALMAERLWVELTRACPSPERADPACLLAVFAYVRGDGGLATIALDVADKACFGHTLTGLLKKAFAAAVSPLLMRELADKAVVRARELVGATAQSSSGRVQS